MTDLLTRLEQATEGSRELDAAIAEQIHPLLKTYQPDPERGAAHWISPKDGKVYALDYTTSLDAALTLVPEGYAWQIKSVDDFFNAWVMRFVPTDNEGSAATPALALCIAALKARK